MKLTVRHTLSFSLGTPPRAVEHLLLHPSATPQQKIERWSIEMPGFAEAAAFRDGYGNRAHLVSQVKPDAELTISINGLVETIDRAGVLGRLEYDTPPALFRRLTTGEGADPALLEGFAGRSDRIAVLHDLMDRVHEKHGGGATQTQSQSQGTDADTAEQSQDSSADFDVAAGVRSFILAARSLGIAARHVTGYLYDAEAARRHAWAEAWDDGLGWIGFDPALALCPVDAHIRLASGLDAASTVAIRAVPALAGEPSESLSITAA